MTEKYKILAKYIKDMFSETPNIETFIFVKDYILNYQLNIDITTKPLKNKMIEINTLMKFEDKQQNKINKKEDILVYVQSKKSSILKNLKKRKNFNQKLLKKFKEVQLPISYKKKMSNFIIKNDFTKRSVNDGIKKILKKIE